MTSHGRTRLTSWRGEKAESAVPGDLSGDALAQTSKPEIIVIASKKRQCIGMSVRIDESRSNDQTRGIKHLTPRQHSCLADSDDNSIDEVDVGFEDLIAGTVGDETATDDETGRHVTPELLSRGSGCFRHPSVSPSSRPRVPLSLIIYKN